MNRREFFLKSILGLASLGFLFGFKKSNNEDEQSPKWDIETENLHPVNPKVWAKAVKYDGVLPEVLSESN